MTKISRFTYSDHLVGLITDLPATHKATRLFV